MGNLQQAAMIACNLFTCRNGGPYRCRHCRADLSHLLRVIGVNHANILEGLPEPTDAPLMTREEWAEKQAVAIAAAARSHDAYYWEVWVTTGCGDPPPEERYVAGVRACGGKLDPIAYGPDPIAALETLAAAAKPAQPDPEDMSAEECEAELRERDDVLFVKRIIEHTVATLCVGGKTVEEWDYLCGEEFILRAAVRALREHQAAQSRT